MMGKVDPVIGRALETVGGERRVQVCRGTFRGDLPDRRFRFNAMFVEHAEDFPVHGHEYSELVLVLGGTAIHRTDREDYAIGAGDVFVINAPDRHGFLAPRRLRLCNLQFDPDQLLSGLRDLEQMPGYQALFRVEPRCGRFRSRLRLSRSERAGALRLARGLEAEFRAGRPGRETVIRSTFALLAADLSRRYPVAERSDPVSGMAEALAHLRTHYREPVRVPALARRAGVSPSRFAADFRRIFGAGPIRVLNRIRIDEACELLRTTDEEISAVARRTGFASPAFFAAQFRRFKGMTPRAYRRAAP